MSFQTLKTAAVLFLVVVAIQLVCSAPELKHDKTDSFDHENQSHNLTLGKRKHGDRLLFRTEISKGRTFLWYTKYDFKYSTNSSEGNRIPNITFIKVVDLVPGNHGGYPTLKSGGPGSPNVTIHLESRWDQGIDFNITIYGR